MGNSRRELDTQQLDELLNMSELTETQREAFVDMKGWLTDHHQLTDKQRSWVKSLHEKLVPQYQNLVSNGLVPRGREVETPEVLRHLPKRPPQRRSAE